jgi:transcriptional regulator with XRE-family HTH domain
MEGDLQRTVGRNLRAHREQRGYSQEAFAQLLGVHRTYLGALERGERNLTLKSLERIAASLNVDPLDLLHG